MSAKNLSTSEQLTYSTVLLKSYNGETSVTGTGFIFEFCQKEDSAIPIIITNKHVIKDSKYIEFEFCNKTDDGAPDDLNSVTINWTTDKWIFHPEDDVDLCCIPIAPILNKLKEDKQKVFFIPLTKELIPLNEEINNYCALEEVSMIGYPIGLSDTYNHKPIIRRGITATHLRKDYQGKKEFLVDMACFPGSSGSPIFLLNEGTYFYNNTVNAGIRVRFIGILYGGPQYNAQGKLVIYENPTIISKTNIPTNLGVAIKAEKILDFEQYFIKMLENSNQ